MNKKAAKLMILVLGALGCLGFSRAWAQNTAPQGQAEIARPWAEGFSVSQSSMSRLLAVKSVFQGPNRRAASALEAAFFQEPRASIRAWMVRAENHSAPGNISFLETALKDPNVFVREAAIVALGESKKPQAVKDLAPLLATEPEPGARITIAFWLGQLGGSSSVVALSQALAQDKDANVRLQAAQSLKEIGSSSALSALKQAANDPNPRVRGLAQGK